MRPRVQLEVVAVELELHAGVAEGGADRLTEGCRPQRRVDEVDLELRADGAGPAAEGRVGEQRLEGA
jgi:hypothetical protein